MLSRLARDDGKLVQLVNIGSLFMTTEYKNFGQAGAFGENAHAENFVQTGGPVDAQQLADQLAAVRKAMDEQAKPGDPEAENRN